jgi:hypothetical protein
VAPRPTPPSRVRTTHTFDCPHALLHAHKMQVSHIARLRTMWTAWPVCASLSPFFPRGVWPLLRFIIYFCFCSVSVSTWMSNAIRPSSPYSANAAPASRETKDPADRIIPALDEIVPADSTKAYNIKDVISKVRCLSRATRVYGCRPNDLITLALHLFHQPRSPDGVRR